LLKTARERAFVLNPDSISSLGQLDWSYMSVIESIVKDLRELPPLQLVEAARFIHGLNPKTLERRREALLATAGCMSGEEGEDFERAVMAESDRIDGDSW